ncbi:MAG: Ig-like domain-containing protein, partial [Bacilli bacterium]|nr:Ig-like domain-containing protein [Bacilli bacterium]
MKKRLLLVLSITMSLFSVNVFATPMRTIYAGSEETITSQTYNVSTGEMQYYTVESADPQYLVADKIKLNGVCASFDNCHHSIDFKVTAISKGTATVYIKDDNGDIVESYFFTIYPGPEMTTIEPENGVYLIAAGDSAYISGYDSGKYSFESSDPSIAVISDTRVLTGIKEGKTTIGAYLPNGGGAALIDVRVYQGAKSIQISGGNRFYNKQNISEKLEVIFNPTNTTFKDVTWKSTNPNIIDVTEDGYPVVKKNGQANIIACTKRDNVCTSITVTASNIIEEFKVKDESKKVNVGETKRIEFETNPTVDFSKKDLKWESNDEKIAKVDKDGKITGISAGKTEITMINNSDSRLVRFEVEVFNPIKSVTPSVKEHTMLVGENFKLTATINPSNTTDDKTLIWESVDKSIATVDKNGNVKAIKAGMTYLSVTASNGKAAMIKINVKNPIKIEKVSLNKSNIELARGTTQKITATITPANTTDSKKITWSSSNTKIVTVDQNGLVKGISNGDAVVTAKFSNGKALNVKVKVKSPIAIKSIKMKQTKVSLAYGNSTALKVSVSPSNATLENNLTWKSSNNKVVKVDKNGKIAAVGAGSATIT